jgi:threonine synthase
LVIPSPVLAVLRARYAAEAVSDDETLRTIRNAHERYGRVIDPHTAVGLATAGRLSHNDDLPIVVLSTAHPAKFPETVAKATGTVPPLPPHLRQSYLGTERASVLPPEADRLRSFIETRTTPHER